MNPDKYRFTDEDDIPCYVREVESPDGSCRFRVCLPADRALFRKALPYAEEICDNPRLFLKAFDLFKQDQSRHYMELFERTGVVEHRDLAEEIDQLTIEEVNCGGGDHFNHAEVLCRDIPGSWRSWLCGYADGTFYDLWY